MVNDVHSSLVSAVRLGMGSRARSVAGRQPERLLELYEFEACPFCRKVREVMTELDLPYLCRPCARGSRHRAELEARGGKRQFPYLVDPNTSAEMYESEDIITYLLETYGTGRSAASKAAAPLNSFGSTLASALRPLGRRVSPAIADRPSPAQHLELYSFEGCPFCRKAREALNELDLIHVVHNVGKGSPRRKELAARGGKVLVPYLIDPNTGAALYESDQIVTYLRATYGRAQG